MQTCFPGIVTTQPRRPAGSIDGLAQWLGSLAARCARVLANRRTVRHLSGLDEYLLHDIGLTRCDIPDAVSRGRPAAWTRMVEDRRRARIAAAGRKKRT